jgi:transposase-like protein
MDETYIKVRGQWKYLYRAVDKAGDTIDFLLTAKRDCAAALRFLRQATASNGVPVKINIDKSGSNTAAIAAYNAEAGTSIEIRQCKYLNNIVEQDHRPVKQKSRAALGFKAFHSAHATIMGVELVRMIRKGQVCPLSGGTAVQQFNALAA